MSAPKLIAGALARDRVADTALAGLGVSAAFVSVCFAGYMIVVGPSGGGRRPGPPLVTGAAPIHPPEPGEAAVAAVAAGGAIDFTPTGSITPAGSGAQTASRTVLRDFAVRDVFDGTALVEANGALHMVGPGDSLDGAGEVLAVERRGRGWVVRTAGGIIRQRP